MHSRALDNLRRSDPDRPALAISVGNSRMSLAVFEGEKRGRYEVVANDPFEAALAMVVSAARETPGAAVLIASVNDPVAERVAHGLIEARALGAGEEPALIGRDIRVPVSHTLDEAGERTVGQDRLLNAVAAYEVAMQACVVVDAGTAITVDFVDGVGTFHGGAIAPGARTMLRSLHEHTSALPDVALALPRSLREERAGPFGRNTPEAMLNGAVFAARGLVRALAERYAEFYEAYPQIIATGGDARLLFEGDELIEAIVPDLTLRGIAATWRRWLAPVAEAPPIEEP